MLRFGKQLVRIADGPTALAVSPKDGVIAAGGSDGHIYLVDPVGATSAPDARIEHGRSG